jgi:serine/threonine protein kinase
MLLDANYHVLLADFGLAAVINNTLPRRSEDVAGTMAYTAPERFQHHYKLTPASDQYSLAVVFYEWLTGQRPFLGTAEQIMHQQLYADPLPLRNIAPDIPQQVESVILKALHKDPEQRFPSVQAFVDALKRAYESSLHHNIISVRIPTRHPSVRPLTGTQTSARHRRSSAAWEWKRNGLDGALVADLFIAMLAGITTFLLWHDENAAWHVFAFFTFAVPIVHAIARKKPLEITVFFSILLLSVALSIALNIFTLLPYVQVILTGLFYIAASLYSIFRHLKHQ